MIGRTYDPTLHNHIANQPGVYELITGHSASGEPLNFIEEALQPDNYVLLHNDDCDAAMIFEWSAAGTYEMHTMFMPTCRGKRAIEVGRAMRDFMFEEIDAFMLWGQTPIGLRHAQWFNRQLGGKPVGTKVHWLLGDCQLFRCTRDEWKLLSQ